MSAKVVPLEVGQKNARVNSSSSRFFRFIRSIFVSSSSSEAKLTEVGLNDEQIEELRMVSTFGDRDLRKLCSRFLILDRDAKQSIHVDDILSMTEFSQCPFRSRLRSVFASSLKSWQVSYREFVDLLSVFGPEANREQKLKFLFRVYDFDDDGALSKTDLTSAIETVVEQICEPGVIDKVVNKIFQECDPEGLGHLTLKQFREALSESDVCLRVRLCL